MTDKPATLAIDQTEWRVLFASNIARVNEFVNQTVALTPESLAQLQDHLERAKLLAVAWQRSSPAVAQGAVSQPAQAQPPIDPKANGEAPKRKGGWPLGKPRKQRMNPAQVQ